MRKDKRVMKYVIKVWSDEFDREEGFSTKYEAKSLGLETLDKIKSFVKEWYSKEIEDVLGSIEIIGVDANGSWHDLYHISEDSNDELEKL
jgi:hypothetical protein